MPKLNIQTLRWGAGVGLALVLLVEFILSFRVRGGWGLAAVMLVLMTLLVALTSRVLMPKAAGALLRSKDLLLPFVLILVAGKLLTWLTTAPFLSGLFKPFLPLQLFNLSFALSLSFLLHIALAVVYATWMTAALLEFVRTGKSDPCQVLSKIPSRCARVCALMFIGWGMTMVITSILVGFMPLLQFFALVPMAFFGVAWNFATAAVLPVAVEAKNGFWRSFRAGIFVSLGYLGRWWFLLLAQMVLLGLVFYYQSRSGGTTNVSWSVNVFWTGSYEDDCKWYEKLAQARHVEKLPFAETLLTLLFGGFAVAIKLAIVQRMKASIAQAESVGISDAGLTTNPN